MSLKGIVADPVFQLNLLVWMTKDQPNGQCRVHPLFSRHGFELHYIEQPFPFPPELHDKIENASRKHAMPVKLHPEPELTIQRSSDGRAVYFEAKSQGFSSASSNAAQARGHLLACGPAFAEVYRPLTSALLDYVVPEEDTVGMRDCLRTLSTELRSEAGLEPGEFAADGLSLNGTNLLYHLDSPLRSLLPTTEGSVVIMADLREDTDPSPLLLVYSDQDLPDEMRRGHYRRVLQNQALATLLCNLHGSPSGHQPTISARDLLVETTIGVFNFLSRARQKGMERLIVENLFKRITEHWKSKLPGKVTLLGHLLGFDFTVASDREAILDWLEDSKKTAFEDTKPAGTNQLELLPQE
jgi:hypothetical protein